jgi:simple sugar transport system permease protein
VKRGGVARLARKYALQIAIVFVALLIWAFFLWRAPRTFLAYDIYYSLMATTPYFALMAIPLTLVIVAKEIDLSFASIMAFGMAGFDVVFLLFSKTNPHLGVWLGFIACLVAGFLAGLLNGVIVVKLGIPSLVATLGTSFFWSGMVLVITNAQGLGLASVAETPLYSVLVGRIGGVIPAQFAWTIAFVIVVWYLLNRTKFGAHVYLTGDNVESARLMGVDVERIKMLVFAIVGLASAFAGFVVSSDLKFFWPTGGGGFLLSTLASVFLGGTSVFGGVGTILGTFLGAFIIGAIEAATVAIGLTGFWTQLIYGLIIVLSVIMHTYLRKRAD